MSLALLPTNSKYFERAIAEAIELPSEVGDAVTDLHGVKYHRPLNVTVAPWLVFEYGLGYISAFFDNYEDLIDDGRVWQGLRGTPQALTTSLSWISYDAITIEDQMRHRRRWHLYQIGMGEIPAASEEVARLTDAEYLAGISDPARSEFFRGYFGYDVRGLEWSGKKWGNSLWGDSSGVRLPGGKTKWSHGRAHEIESYANITDWADLNIDFVNGLSFPWTSDITWNAPGVTWNEVSDAGFLKAWSILRKRTYMAFLRADETVIGYALVIMAPVDITPAETDYGDEFFIQYTVQTGFGDGAGEAAAFAAIAFNASPVAGVKSFKRWLTPDEIQFTGAEVVVGQTAFDLPFMLTVRERIVFTLGF
jgi:hypothetical protein